MLAYGVDLHLGEVGAVPDGWVQPPMEVYETELAGRPSLLPIETIEEAVQAGHCPPRVHSRYLAWQEAQDLEESEEVAATPEE